MHGCMLWEATVWSQVYKLNSEPQKTRSSGSHWSIVPSKKDVKTHMKAFCISDVTIWSTREQANGGQIGRSPLVPINFPCTSPRFLQSSQWKKRCKLINKHNYNGIQRVSIKKINETQTINKAYTIRSRSLVITIVNTNPGAVFPLLSQSAKYMGLRRAGNTRIKNQTQANTSGTVTSRCMIFARSGKFPFNKGPPEI